MSKNNGKAREGEGGEKMIDASGRDPTTYSTHKHRPYAPLTAATTTRQCPGPSINQSGGGGTFSQRIETLPTTYCKDVLHNVIFRETTSISSIATILLVVGTSVVLVARHRGRALPVRICQRALGKMMPFLALELCLPA